MAFEWDNRRFGPYEDARFTLRQAVDFALHGNEYALAALASIGPVARWGRPGGMDSRPEPIPFAELGDYDEIDADHSTWTTARRRWLDVRLVPVLEAPNRAEYFAAGTLSDLISKYVAEDLLVDREREDGGRFRPIDPIRESPRFPIGLNEIDAGIRMARAAADNRRASGQKPLGLGHYYHRLAQRLNLLVTMIREDGVMTTGLPTKASVRSPIDRAWWSRPSIVLDLLAGDILSTSGDVEWFSVGFTTAGSVDGNADIGTREPEPKAVVGRGDDEPAIDEPGRTTAEDLAVEALRALYPNGRPKGMRNAQIIEKVRKRMQEEHGYADGVPGKSTIEKAIARYSKRP